MHSPPAILAELTAEQREALRDLGRITLISAGPGTGKTRVFVTEFQRRLAEWRSGRSGIAALSFTNVARDEIAKRLGGAPAPPHFVGTLDAFVWRFVVRPFAHVAGVTPKGPRLIPAPVHRAIERPSLKVGDEDGDQEALFRLVLQLAGAGVRVMREGRWGVEEVPDEYVQAIVDAKKREWARNGRLTHSDCQAVATKILHGAKGEAIVDRIVRRFPVFLVDEFQDTTSFLGLVLLRLLRHERAAAVVVGDRDQAIFSFGGADRELFEKLTSLPGAVARPLRTTHRFGSRLAAVASHLSRSGQSIVSHQNAPNGRALLLIHDQAGVDLSEATETTLAEILAQERCGSAALIARKHNWLRRFGVSGISRGCPLASKAAQRLNEAVELLRAGDTAPAAAIVARDLAELVIGDGDVSRESLRAGGIDPLIWRRALRRLLFEAAEPADETWSTWLFRMKGAFSYQVGALGVEVEKRRYSDMFKKRFRPGRTDGPRQLALPPARATQWEPLTVHAAKGREFDATIVYCPRPGGQARVKCPSAEWWSTDLGSEEREVAYVAVTRARKLLVLCLHRDTVAAIKTKQPDFLRLFEAVP